MVFTRNVFKSFVFNYVMGSKSIKDKFIYIPVIVLSLYLIIRLIDKASIINSFPLDFDNDISSYLAYLFFLAKCGWNNLCGYWYNGIIPFQSYTPGWFFFTFPIYILTNKVTLSAYISLLLITLLSFLVINSIGKIKNYSLVKRFFIFLFLFGNPITVGNFIRLGRLPEMMGFLTFMTLFLFFIYYFNKKLDLKFLIFFSIVYFAIIISSAHFAVLSQILVISFLIIRDYKEKIKIIAGAFLGIIFSSFWLLDFLKSKFFGTLGDYSPLGKSQLLLFTKEHLLTNLALIIVPLIFIFVFYFYYKQHKENKKLILFYTPVLVLSILVFSRAVTIIPILNDLPSDPYLEFILFFTLILFFDTNLSLYKTKFIDFIKIIKPTIVLLPMLLVMISIFYTPWSRGYTKLEYDTLNLMSKIDDKFIIYGEGYPTSYAAAYYSYAPIYLNLSTSSGWAPITKPKSYYELLSESKNALNNLDCKNFKSLVAKLNTTNFIGFKDFCSNLKKCGLIKIEERENVCLYKK